MPTSTSGRWNGDLTPPWGVSAGIDSVVRQLEIAHPALLPDVQIGPTLIVTSDYGGQHKSATHESFSYLIADLQFCWLWDEMRQHVRASLLKDNRRMSYKGLNDKRRRRALLPFLSASDMIPGLLATVLVDKQFLRLHRLTPDDRMQLPQVVADWPEQVINKMVFVAHLGALFIAGLSREWQNVLWLSDADDFVANDERVIGMTPLFAGIISRYSRRSMGHFRLGTTKSDNGDLSIEDLAALPDLACGALCDVAVPGLLPKMTGIQVPLLGNVPLKASVIASWLAESQKPLRRLMFVVDEGDSSAKVRVRALELSCDKLGA